MKYNAVVVFRDQGSIQFPCDYYVSQLGEGCIVLVAGDDRIFLNWGDIVSIHFRKQESDNADV